jgi:hypothetical protein
MILRDNKNKEKAKHKMAQAYIFSEHIDMDRLRLILSNFDYLFQQGLLVQKDAKYRDINDYNGVKNLLFQLLETHDEDGYASVEYRPSDYNPEGRLWASIFSTQGLSRIVRGYLCENTMVDFDMKNAHPTILLQLCQRYDIPYDYLQSYVDNREEIINKLMENGIGEDRDDVKRLILKIMNGGYSFHTKSHEWLGKFHEELKCIRESLRKHYPKEYEIATFAKKRKQSNYNIDGSGLNMVLCKYERQYLDKMIKYAISKDLRIGSLCHDGNMLIKDDSLDYDSIAKDLSLYSGMTILRKVHEEPILQTV